MWREKTVHARWQGKTRSICGLVEGGAQFHPDMDYDDDVLEWEYESERDSAPCCNRCLTALYRRIDANALAARGQ